MQNKSSLIVLTLAAATALAASACSGSSDTSTYGSGATGSGATGSGATGSGATGSGATGSGATGSGATGSGGTGNTYVPPTCGQACQDYLVAWGLNDTIWFLWNQRIAGTPSGPEDITGACPLGGQVQITGMTTVADNGVSTVDLVFDFDGCENSPEYYDLTFTGSVIMEGTFEAVTEFAALTFSSTDLESTGTLNYLDDPAVGETCDTNLMQQGGGDSFALSGRRCGRNVSESSLDPTGSGGSGSGGSTGSGGSSSSGGSGSTACNCYCPDGSDCTNSTEPNPCGVDTNGIPEACGCPVNCP